MARGLPGNSPLVDGDGEDVPALELSNSSLLLAGDGTAVVEALRAGLIRPFSAAVLVTGEARLVTTLGSGAGGATIVGGTLGPAVILKGDVFVPYFASDKTGDNEF